ncbi:ABC transporter ATP-binding protein [Bacterioplanes sanyensis]|nr:ATP-binding cassette domain-containing protein [Bacterioplanes sanyensis]
MPDIAMISIHELQFSYADQTVLNIPAWQIEPGERVLLHGESGSGKSTLLHLLAGLSTPNTGAICIGEQTINQLSARRRDAFRARHLGFIAQRLNLIPYLSVLDNVLLAAHLSHTAKRDSAHGGVRTHAIELLQQVNLPESLFHKTAQQLSLGQQQRVAIVRAMIHQPSVILADEPTSALDSHNRDLFMQQLQQLCSANNITLVMVSHDLTLATHFSQVQALTDINQTGAV